MRSLHICYLCNEYPPAVHGGIGTLTQTLSRAMVDRGHHITVLGVYDDLNEIRRENDHGVQIVRLPHTKIKGGGLVVNGWRVSRELHRIQRARPIDILEGPELSLALVSAHFPATKIIRMSGGHHFFSDTLGTQKRRLAALVERLSFRRADGFAAVSHYVARRTRALLGIPKHEHVEILHNPVDTETTFSPRPRSIQEEGLLLFWGTLCEKKGVRQLIQAMPRIKETIPEARLWIAGREGVDVESGRPFMQVLRAHLDADVADRIRFLGPVHHHGLPELIARASVCVLPSHMEAFGIAWAEGMAMEKAVVGSRTGPGPEIVTHNVTGRLCNPHDPNSIAAEVIALLRNKEMRSRLGASARREARRSFSTIAMADRNEAFYGSWAKSVP